MVFKFFDKKSVKSSGFKFAIKQNEQLPEEPHKPIIKKFRNCQVYLSFQDNIWGADLADTQLISKFNK